ncbi:nonsense-mediated mRNA decay factor SMG7-like [Salvia hispanica]|uniref:nonsense-mediated mRNA decay factor SMG7-like n=1 Tax=Salvia hispanica TaxID=49212 RepID=UPI002009B017|nr:nonsense-mediated mRNA decay factor SMG7-like [Salvia hispanica]XP_047940749.1 nonsense-mediated mRNA decay factor SMG7-like [Salvia hispanica]XP_047940750.1 nonsense-mediated mRNA decay factor SMG7-like [Salvia hispanica]XP_047940751.1 nonsense-mediated mRNA decay factor SMG7-like [Salvia hispanica]
MTLVMDSDKGNPTRERVQQLFNKNVELENKRRKAAQARIPSDPNTWQNMRENYEAIILEDHAFSEQHDIEYALWQLHYRRIEELRALFAAAASAGSPAPQNGKGTLRAVPDRLTKIRTQFKTFLSEATGFYHDLMLKIRSKYGLPLGYSSDDPENQIPMSKDGNTSSEGKKGLMSCHRCLIYLGDLARYKSLYGEGDSKARDFAAASSYYLQASSIWPSSGNPHHQLAILAGYSNDELLSIYRYFRSLAVDIPFVTARDNLIIAFEKNRQNYSQILGDGKAPSVKMSPARLPGKGKGKGEPRHALKENKPVASTLKERAPNKSELFKAFITKFIRLNGILFTRTSLEIFPEAFSMVKSDLLELLSSGPDDELNFGSDATECRLAIIRMIAILIFTVHNVSREGENQSYADILQRSVLLQNAFTASFEFVGSILERCNHLSDPSSSYLLPGIMVFVEWLACRQDFAVGSELEEKQVNARSFFWNKCIVFLNKLLSSGLVSITEDEDETCFSNMSKYDESETANRLALPEDFELRGFHPLLPAQLILDFSRKHLFVGDGGSKERIARVKRIIAAGKALANVVRVGPDGVYFDDRMKKFVFGSEPQVPDENLLPSHLEPNVNDNSLDISSVGRMALAALPKIEVRVEADDEDDEVIVFRPPTTERHMDEFSLKLTSPAISASVSEASKVNFGNEKGSLSGVQDGFLLQSALTAGMESFASGFNTVANGTTQYPQPIQPSTSMCSSNHSPIASGMAQMNLMANGVRSDLQDKFEVYQHASVSLPYPQFMNAGPSHNHPIMNPQASVPSKFDSIIPSGSFVDGLSIKPSLAMPPGSKKNPVSRPVRHIGPPPGFGSVRSKVVDEALFNSNPQNGTSLPQTDDYSWLDGYQLSSSNQGGGFSNSGNQVVPAFPSVSNINGLMGTATFPFPGKQVPIQVQSNKQNGWQEHPYSEHMLHYEEQQKEFQKGNQQLGLPQQQYQGQSLWEGRFFV